MTAALNLALFGLGRAGHFHLQSIRAASRIRLLHVVDVDEQVARSVAEEYQCQGATNPEAALNDPKVQAVIVATPTETHYDCILAALNAGKAVFTEKPLGVRLSEIDDCYALAARVQKPLFLGFMRRFDPTFSNLAASVHDGEIGRLQVVKTTSRDSPLPTIDYIKTSHGIFHDCIVHDLDMIRFITRSEPSEIFAMGSNFIPAIEEIGDLDNVMVTLKFPDGILCCIDVNRNSPYGYDQRIEVFGSEGMLQAENRMPTTNVKATRSGMTRPTIEHSFPTRYREAYLRELETFRDCVLDNVPVPITHTDARQNFLLAEAAERSYREQQVIPVKY